MITFSNSIKLSATRSMYLNLFRKQFVKLISSCISYKQIFLNYWEKKIKMHCIYDIQDLYFHFIVIEYKIMSMLKVNRFQIRNFN